MPSGAFEDLTPWPEGAPPPAHHNQPPLEDRVVFDFEEALRRAGIDERVVELAEAADRCPEIDSAEVCGKAGDLVAAARAATEKVENEREKLNRPLLTAQRQLKNRADRCLAPLDRSIGMLRKRMDAFMAGEDEAVRGDYGALVSRQELWEFKLLDVADLPVDVRCAPEVVDTIKKVIAARIRAGTRQMAGVEIYPSVKARVR
jgi:hypothetical protein